MQITPLLIAGLACLAQADSYANFFNDKNCKTNKGNGVDMNNPGCLNQNGRGSVYLSNNLGKKYQLCAYNKSNCKEGAGTYKFSATGFCWKLDTAKKSYRFKPQNERC